MMESTLCNPKDFILTFHWTTGQTTTLDSMFGATGSEEITAQTKSTKPRPQLSLADSVRNIFFSIKVRK